MHEECRHHSRRGSSKKGNLLSVLILKTTTHSTFSAHLFNPTMNIAVMTKSWNATPQKGTSHRIRAISQGGNGVTVELPYLDPRGTSCPDVR